MSKQENMDKKKEREVERRYNDCERKGQREDGEQ